MTQPEEASEPTPRATEHIYPRDSYQPPPDVHDRIPGTVFRNVKNPDIL